MEKDDEFMGNGWTASCCIFTTTIGRNTTL